MGGFVIFTGKLFSFIYILLSMGAQAEEVPPRYRGLLGAADASGQCADDRPLILLNGATVAYVDMSRGAPTLIIGDAEWADGAVFLNRGPEFSVLPSLDSLDRCTRPPAMVGAMFGEALALFASLDDMRAQCAGRDARRCVDALYGALDVSRDRRLAPAEVARGIRATAVFLSYEGLAAKQRSDAGADATIAADAVLIGDVYASSLAAAVAAPFVTTSILDSYDFDGDGFLSPQELLQDRAEVDPEALAMALGVRLGEDGLRGIVANLPALMQQLSGGLLPSLLGLR